MLGVVSILVPYIISNIKNSKWWIQNDDHLAKILGENTKNGKIEIVGSKILKIIKIIIIKIIFILTNNDKKTVFRFT